MAKRCGRCEYFTKVQFNDRPNALHHGRNGICDKYDYNVFADGTYASKCVGYKSKKYKRILRYDN